MFIPLMKADAAQRLVYGSIDETPDRAGEVMDYATAKAAFQDWSTEMQKASDGKSYGNIRGQHSNIAAGKLDQEIEYDDEAKRISFCGRIVDDNEWRKVEEGVYTGFSPGGRYVKRWQDGSHKRYTPKVGELSIVDVPCITTAGFSLIKADGSEEQRDFVIAKAYEPGNEATVERAEALAKAAGKDGRKNDFLVKARAELIAENADQALAKMADAEEPAPADTKDDPVAKLDAALAKADAVVVPVVATGTDVPVQFQDLTKACTALSLLSAEPLAKSLWSVQWLTRLMQDFADLQSSVTWDEKFAADGGDMTIPQKAAEIVQSIGALLVSMTQEGVADILTCMENNGLEIVIIEGDADDMALAASIVDLVKADTDLMEKAGKRNSKGDAAKIQSMHDNAVALGATCEADANKDALSVLEADRDRLAKAVDGAVPQIEALTEKVEDALGQLSKATARIAELESRPELAKGVVFAVDKEKDGLETPVESEKPKSLIAQARQIAASR